MREPPAPPHVPDYELLREIGRGSYGVVWLARSVTGLYRAVKIVWRASFEEPQPYEREFRGIREFAAISLHTPRQLALLHVGRNDAAGFFYYVMELADDADTGRDIHPARYRPNTLKELSQRRGRLPTADAIKLGVELAEGLAELHRHGLVHRDIKPSNIIFAGGAPKLADIGLIASARTTDLTLSRVGNAGYMPPDFPGTASADAYGLGKVLYELVTGRRREDFPALPPNLSSFADRKDLLELNEVLLRACAPNPENRYPNAGALVEELRLLQAGKSVRRLRAAERHLGRALRTAAVLGIVAILAGGGAWAAWRVAKQQMALREKAEAERDIERQRSIYAAGLTRAQRALETSELGRARRLLEEITPAQGGIELRGLEWHALWREAQGDASTVLRESGPTIIRTRVSRDGAILATLSFGQNVTLWDAKTGQIIRRLTHIADIGGFSPDGKWLIGTNARFELQRWSLATGTVEEHAAPGTNRPLGASGVDGGVSFVDGRSDVTNAAGKKEREPHIVRRWSFPHRSEAWRIVLPNGPDGQRWDFYRGTVSADGSVVALALVGPPQIGRWRLLVFDGPTQQLLFEDRSDHRITGLALSNDGTRLAVALGDSANVGLVDISRRAWTWKRSFGSNQPNCLGFDPSETLLAIGGRDSVVRFADAATGALIGDRLGHQAGIEDLVWIDQTTLGSGGTAGDLRIWDTKAHVSSGIIAGLGSTPAGGRSLCIAADGSALAVTDIAGSVRVFSLPNLQELVRLPKRAQPLRFDPTGNELWTLGVDGTLERTELATSKIVQAPHPTESNAPTFPAVAENGRLLMYGDRAGVLHWCDLSTGQRIAQSAVRAGSIWWCALSRDARLGLSSGEDRRLRIWDTATFHEIQSFNSPHRIYHAAFSPDGQTIALALANGTLDIRGIPSLTVKQSLRTENSTLYAVAFSPDGSRLWCAGSGGEIAVYATSDWRPIVDLTLKRAGRDASSTTRPISLLASDPAGAVLAAGTEDGRVRIWQR